MNAAGWSIWQRWRTAILGTSMVMLGSRLGDACNFMYSIVLARWLGDGDFGRASALMLALGIPAATINVIVCRETVWRLEHQESRALRAFVWRWFWRTCAVGVLAAALIILLNPYVGTILRYEQPAVGVGFALLFLLTLLRPFWQSVVQGQERFLIIALGPMLEGFLRVTLTMLFLYFLRAGLQGVVAAQALTGVVLLLYGMWFGVRGGDSQLRGPTSCVSTKEGTPCTTTWRAVVASLLMTTALTLLTSTDVIVVNFVFPGPIADAYAAVATLGRIVLYVPESLAITLLPGLVRDAVRARSSQGTVLAAVGVTVVTTLALVALFAVGGAVILRWVYARGFDAYAHLLPWYAAAMGAVAICRVCGTHAMARARITDGIVLLGMASLQVLGFYCFRRTVEQTTWVLAATSALAALVSVLVTLYIQRSSGQTLSSRT